MSRLHLLLLTLLLAVAVPFAAADTINLNFHNTTIGTVTLTQQSGGVMVTFSANSGFSLKLQGGDLLFNSNVSLTASNISQLMINGTAFTGTFKFGPGHAGGQDFGFDITQLNIHGVTSVKTISFFISGVTIQDLTAFGVHFCTGDGPKCQNPTNFAFSGGSTAVPEPGTLGLLGTGIVALAGVFRRRFIS